VRLKRVAALRGAIAAGTYRVETGQLSSALLHPDALNLAGLLSRHPALIPEHIARHGRAAARDLLLVLETRDHFTGQHCARATGLALRFARHLGLPPTDLELLQTAGYLHDIGKVEIFKTVLLKPGPLSPADRSLIESHPGTGVRIARPLDLGPREQEIILHHHEHWDGRGYPKGLAGEQIPFLCRLMALADVFEALTSDRPYRRRLPVQQALAVIRDRSGSQFDPHLAGEFLQAFGKENKF
jgi:putative nucleotidyltransferase with HDIG domain